MRRDPDANDGRGTYAVITPAGTKALHETAPMYLAGIEEHFTRHLTDAEQRCVAEGLSRVVAAHERVPISIR